MWGKGFISSKLRSVSGAILRGIFAIFHINRMAPLQEVSFNAARRFDILTLSVRNILSSSAGVETDIPALMMLR